VVLLFLRNTAPQDSSSTTMTKACVNVMGSIDDKSFNATVWKGVTNAIKNMDIKGVYLESIQQSDYEKDITAFLTQDCSIIITVGSLMQDATKLVAETNPYQKFAHC